MQVLFYPLMRKSRQGAQSEFRRIHLLLIDETESTELIVLQTIKNNFFGSENINYTPSFHWE